VKKPFDFMSNGFFILIPFVETKIFN